MAPLLSVYLDQLDNDPIEACKFAAELGITNVCLRRVWSTQIGDARPDMHDRIRTAIKDHGLHVAMIDSNLGIQITNAADELNKVNELLKICQAYECQQLVVKWGRRTKLINNINIPVWLEAVSATSLDWAVQPLYPLTADSAVIDPAILAALLHSSKRWKTVYDPAALVSCNHITKYWPLMRDRVWGFEFRDSLPGSGYCTVGAGAAKLDVLLSEWASGRTRAWLILKPNARPNTIVKPQFLAYLAQVRSLASSIGVLDKIQINWPNEKIHGH